MNDHFESLDATIAAIRTECETKIKEMTDRLLAAEIEATMAKDQLAKAIIAKEDAIQVASRLIERFALAEEALAGARKYATTFAPVPPADHPLLPKVEMTDATGK